MKRMKKNKVVPIAALALAVFISLALMSCPMSLEKSVDEAYLSLSASAATAVPAAFVGTRPPANFLPYFENRFLKKTRTVDGNTRVVVIHNSELSRLSAADVRAAKSVYNSGGVIVLLEPRVSNIYPFTKLLGATSFLSAEESTHEFCDIYAFKQDQTFIVADIHPVDPVTVTKTETSMGDSADEPDVTETTTEDVIPNEKPLSAMEYNSLMDGIIEWINTNAPVGAPVQSKQMSQSLLDSVRADAALSDIVKTAADFTPQEVTINQMVPATIVYKSFYWSLLGKWYTTERSVNNLVIFNYTIYAAHDKANNTDHYLVDNEIQVENGTSYDTAPDYFEKLMDPGEIWGYMTYVKSSQHLSGGHFIQGNVLDGIDDYEIANMSDEEWDLLWRESQDHPIIGNEIIPDRTIVSIQNVSPLTSVGSSSTSVTSKISVSGTIDLKGIPKISGGYEKTVSNTVTLPDVVIENRANQAAYALASWEYKIAARPQVVNKTSIWTKDTFDDHTGYLTAPPEISFTTAFFRQAWLWKVQNPKQFAQLAMDISFTGEWGGTHGLANLIVSDDIHHGTGSSGELKHRIVLDRPAYSD